MPALASWIEATSSLPRLLTGVRQREAPNASGQTIIDAILKRAYARRMSSEEFDRYFGDLPTDGEG